jgi:hypothetical protein
MTEMTASEERPEREAGLSYQEDFRTNMCTAVTGNILFLCLIALAALIAFPKAAWSQIVSSSSQFHPSDAYTLRVDANLVILSATALNRHNALVSGLV